MRSSYIKNNYGAIFERLVYAFLPSVCVELGVLDGYSTFHIAKGILRAHRCRDHRSHLHAYDLWDDYEFKHGNKSDVESLLVTHELDQYVHLYKENAYKVSDLFCDKSVCFLHIDISNDGDVLKRMVELWHPKLTFGGIIAFEGGSEERDNVDWMKKYEKRSIKDELHRSEFIRKHFRYGTYLSFPSLTILMKQV